MEAVHSLPPRTHFNNRMSDRLSVSGRPGVKGPSLDFLLHSPRALPCCCTMARTLVLAGVLLW
jgi:hypothetical protein